jgi:uncharacterized protein YbjT (DUF2867 family)
LPIDSEAKVGEGFQRGGVVILVTGATGKNGTEIVTRLAAMGLSFRAMARQVPKQQAHRLPNVEYVTADFDNPESLRLVLTQVDRAFLVTPSSEKVEEQQLRFIELAREAGVKHIVYLSQLHASEASPCRFLRYHAVVEQALAASGIAATHLRPNLYMQALLIFKATIASKGTIAAPIGQAAVSVVDVRDIAAIAVTALTQNGHEGQSYDITGPEALTHTEMAACLEKILRRPVTFEDVSAAAMRKALVGFHVPVWQADGLIEDYEHYRSGEGSVVSPDVERVTGRTPIYFHQFARDFSKAFLQ